MPSSGHRLPFVSRLMVQDFRSYATAQLDFEHRLIAFTGENGAGKTNLLEALSLFTPGRGLRRIDLGDMARHGSSGGFSISLTLNDEEGDSRRLGTGYEPAGSETPGRRSRIDGVSVSSATAFADHVRLVWLTPAFDGLFAGPAGDRRRFLDRLVLAVNPEHGSRVSALERALRSRNKLLEQDRPDDTWLDAIEHEIAETGVAVAAARRETLGRLAGLILESRDDTSPFPWAQLALDGPIEAELATSAALDVEDSYRDWLRDSRWRDKAAGRTLIGPQASDLVVHHGPKGIEAHHASTGEQKALLIGLVLAHAQLLSTMSGLAPLILLDEVAAHLDPRRRQALFERLDAMGVQVFMTGADPGAFAKMPASAECWTITPGAAVRL
jgi:DNA replication and repair protein RecF